MTQNQPSDQRPNAESDVLDWAQVEWYYDHHGTLYEFCDWLEGAVREHVARTLNEAERRIRHQAEATEIGSMEWRAHMADLMLLNSVRTYPTSPGAEGSHE